MKFEIDIPEIKESDCANFVFDIQTFKLCANCIGSQCKECKYHRITGHMEGEKLFYIIKEDFEACYKPIHIDDDYVSGDPIRSYPAKIIIKENNE